MFMIMKEKKSQSWYDGAVLKTAFRNALRKFDPRVLSKNFVMFITAAGALMATIALIRDLAAGQPFGFTLQIALSPTLRKRWRRAGERRMRTL